MIDLIYELKFIIQFLSYVQCRFGILDLFIPGLVLPLLSEITYLGLVKFSNHILVMFSKSQICKFVSEEEDLNCEIECENVIVGWSVQSCCRQRN